jgi:prevent-host-death family protein
MTAISATEVRSNFSEILGRVAYGKERVTIERRGRPLAVLLPIEDLARLEAGVGGGPASASQILSAVTDNIPGTVYQRVQYPDGREEYGYISPGIRDTLGIEPEAMLADPAILNRAIHPKDRELRARAIAESARALSTYDLQYRVRTPAGETKWLHAIARPERRPDGAIVWTGITLNVTASKQTEEALRQSEARLRDLIDGAAMDTFPGRTTADFLPTDVAEIYMATDREMVATGRSIQQEVVEDWTAPPAIL